MKYSTYMKRFLILLVVIFLCQGINPPITANAGSWTEGTEDDDSIYGTNNNSTPTPREDIEPDFLSKMVGTMIKTWGGIFYMEFDNYGISINKIVMGRVDGNSNNGVALFTFELKENNPYGVIGGLLYAIFRGIAYILLFLTIFAKVVRNTFMGATPKARENLKETITKFILSFLLLTVMPYFLDVVLYMRDIFLSVLANLHLSPTDIIVHFYLNSDGFLYSLMFFALICFTIYLALQYVGYAMSFLINFIAFPFIVVGSNVDKNLLGNWLKEVISLVCIPILDTSLLLIPAFLGSLKIGLDLSGITFLVCMMVVPARNILRRLLGLSQSNGLDMVGMSMLLGVGKLVSSAGSAIKRTIGGVTGARSDMKMSKFLTETGNKTGNGTIGLSSQSDGSFSTMGSINYGSTNSVNSQPSSFSSPLGFNRGEQSGWSSDIADKYANIHNFETAPFSRNISTQKAAELYRRRAGARMLGAIGTGVGSIAGGVMGMGAATFYGPAAMTTAGSLGINAGSSLGTATSNLYDLIQAGISDMQDGNNYIQNANSSSFANSFTPDMSNIGAMTVTETVEKVNGESINIKMPSVTRQSASQVKGDNSMKEVIDLCKRNAQSAKQAATYVQNSYIDHPEQYMAPIWNSIKSDSSLSSLDAKRDAFRKKVAENYINDFTKTYMASGNTVLSGNENVDNQSMDAYKRMLSNIVLDKTNSSSWLSDNAMNNYSWMA